jgi:hypothetical protein
MKMLKTKSIRFNLLNDFLFVVACGLFGLVTTSYAFAEEAEISGYVGGQVRLFPNNSLYQGQSNHSVSVVAQPEYYKEFEDGSSFTFVPFFRLDSADPERTHFDVRELTYLWLKDDFELRVGVRKLFWGVTEGFHLVNIINQIDLVENIDFEDFLGQPMVNLSLDKNWGTLDFFLLPYFRERTFPGKGGRLRGEPIIAVGQAQYGSGAKEWHSDLALRYTQVFGDIDFGVYHFYGTSREPALLADQDENGSPILIPFYQVINQTATDISYVVEDWLWKFEGFYRTGQGDPLFAWTGGFEYTFTGIWKTRMDLGVLGEWLYDDRGRFATTAFENDLLGGLRLVLNDEDSTEFLAGWIQDVGNPAAVTFIETSRRFSDNIKATLEVRTFINQDESDLFFQQRNDDLFQLEVEYYF